MWYYVFFLIFEYILGESLTNYKQEVKNDRTDEDTETENVNKKLRRLFMYGTSILIDFYKGE